MRTDHSFANKGNILSSKVVIYSYKFLNTFTQNLRVKSIKSFQSVLRKIRFTFTHFQIAVNELMRIIKPSKAILFIAILQLINVSAFSQAPQKLSYQAVIRNADNKLVTNAAVGMKISILQGSPTGTMVYTETQNLSTNANGLITAEIGGAAGFNTIDWTKTPYFIKTETDPSGGSNYSIVGTSQLLSTPYALHANNGFGGKSTDLQAGDMMYYDGSKWNRLPKGNAGQTMCIDSTGMPGWKNLSQLSTPTITIKPLGDIADTSATISAEVNTKGFKTIVTIEYGTSTSYGKSIQLQDPSSNTTFAINTIINGLAPYTTYHYRIKAENALQVVISNDQQFMTNNTPTDLYIRDSFSKIDGVSSSCPDIICRKEMITDSSSDVFDFVYNRIDDPSNAYYQNLEIGQDNYIYFRVFNKSAVPKCVKFNIYITSPSCFAYPSNWVKVNETDREISIDGKIGSNVGYCVDYIVMPKSQMDFLRSLFPNETHFILIAVINVDTMEPLRAAIDSKAKFESFVGTNGYVSCRYVDIQ